MPQTTRRGMVPLNPRPRWPEGYIAVLREAGAQEKTIPHCLAWVRRFFAKYPGRRRRDLGWTEIEAFLAETAQHLGVSNRPVTLWNCNCKLGSGHDNMLIIHN